MKNTKSVSIVIFIIVITKVGELESVNTTLFLIY